MESQISKEQYQAVFMKFSEDQKTVSLEKIPDILTEFGKDPESDVIRKIFSQQYFITGHVDFDSFYSNMKQLDEGKNPKTVLGKLKINLKASKLQKIISESVQENFGVGGVGGKPQGQNAVLDWNIQMGSNFENSKIQVEARIGSEKQKILEQVSFAEVQDNQTCVIVNFKSEYSNSASQQFQEIVEQSMAMAEAMLPEKFHDILQSVKFDYYTPDQSNLYVKISSNHELLEAVTDQSKVISEMVSPDLVIDFVAQTRLSLENINSNRETECLTFLTQNSPFNLHLHAEGGHQMIKTGKELVNASLNKLPRFILDGPVFLLLLFQSLKVDLKFNDFSQLYKIYQAKELLTSKTLSQTFKLNNLDSLTEAYKGAIEEIPIVQTIVEFFRKQIIADLGVFVLAPQVGVKVNVKLPGLGSFVDYYLDK